MNFIAASYLSDINRKPFSPALLQHMALSVLIQSMDNGEKISSAECLDAVWLSKQQRKVKQFLSNEINLHMLSKPVMPFDSYDLYKSRFSLKKISKLGVFLTTMSKDEIGNLSSKTIDEVEYGSQKIDANEIIIKQLQYSPDIHEQVKVLYDNKRIALLNAYNHQVSKWSYNTLNQKSINCSFEAISEAFKIEMQKLAENKEAIESSKIVFCLYNTQEDAATGVFTNVSDILKMLVSHDNVSKIGHKQPLIKDYSNEWLPTGMFDCNGYSLSDFPVALFSSLINCTTINLRHCQLSKLPDLSSIKGLELLDVSYNNIYFIHPSLNKQQNIVYLCMIENPMYDVAIKKYKKDKSEDIDAAIGKVSNHIRYAINIFFRERPSDLQYLLKKIEQPLQEKLRKGEMVDSFNEAAQFNSFACALAIYNWQQ